jgi:hypothetical protein
VSEPVNAQAENLYLTPSAQRKTALAQQLDQGGMKIANLQPQAEKIVTVAG